MEIYSQGGAFDLWTSMGPPQGYGNISLSAWTKKYFLQWKKYLKYQMKISEMCIKQISTTHQGWRPKVEIEGDRGMVY